MPTRAARLPGLPAGRRTVAWLAVLSVLAGLLTLTVEAGAAHAGSTGDRRPARVVALYTFDEGSGRVVHDRARAGAPLDLRLRRGARWAKHGLVLRGGSGLVSVRPARRLVRRAARTGAVTVEMWLRSDGVRSRRLRPLLSLSRPGGPGPRRVVLAEAGQDRRDTSFFSRPRSGRTAVSPRRSDAAARAGRLTHLVWTRTARGTESLFVDGERAAVGRTATSPLTGSRARHLVLGGGAGGHGWRGVLRRVAVLDRALRPGRVARRHARGPDPTRTRPAPSTEPVAAPTGGAASRPGSGGGRPLLIKHGWDMPSPAYVRDHVAEMQALPFDGLTVAVPGLGDKVQRQTPVSYERFRDVLAPLAPVAQTRLRHNFVTVYSTPAGSVFDDWSVPVANFANLARAASEVGVEGILFDNEEYFGSVSDFPRACPGHTLAQCQDQARLRGRQIMDAMRAVWPDVKVMTTYGPWVSEPRTYDALAGVLPFNDVSAANELMGPVVVGMVESAAGTPAKVIDGGEIYSARTAAQFAAITDWQTRGMPAQSPLVPRSLVSGWGSTVEPAVGIYDRSWLGVPMDLDTFGRTVRTALAGGASYVWVYSERYDWWGSGWPETPVPAAWVEATTAASAR